MTTTSLISVVGQILNELGLPAVININDSAAAMLLQNKLNLLLPNLLAKAEWNFATKYIYNNTPNLISFSPDFLYSYTLPSDYGRFSALSPISTYNASFGLYYAIIDGLFCTNTKPLQLYYIVNNADYGVLPPAFTQCLVFYGAFMSCMALTNNENLTIYLQKKYNDSFNDAVRYNDMERMVISTPFNDFNRQVYI